MSEQPKPDIVSIINCDDSAEADVVLMAVPYGDTVSFGQGAEHAPAAIRACLDRQIEPYHWPTQATPVERLWIAWQYVGGNPLDQSFVSPERMVEAVEQAYSFGLSQGKFIVAIGGEHSVPVGIFRALAKKHRPEEVTILQIDAHYDLRQDDSDFMDEPHGPYAHCSVMRRAAELGYQIVSVGIRDYSREEQLFAESLCREGRMCVLPYDRDWPVQPSPHDERLQAEKVLGAISTEAVYLTLDVDGLDPAYMPATGTPVSGGLSWDFVRALIAELFEKKEVIGADVVEVAVRDPNRLDHAERLTVRNAAQLVYDMIACRARSSIS